MLLRLFGVILFCVKPELAHSMVIGRANAQELGGFLGDSKIAPFNGSDPYPEGYQVILTILGQECCFNNALFTPENE